MKSILRASVNYLPYELRHWVKHLPGIAGLQRRLVSHVLAGEPFIHAINAGPAAGLRFEVTLPMDKAIWAGTCEPLFAAAIADGVKQGDVCYDIGGYRGYMTGVMALAGASRVIVFEPLPENQAALRRLCALNPQLTIELQSFAVGDSDGTIELKVMPDASMGKLVTSSFQAGVPFAAVIDVTIRRLDTLVASREIPPPNLIKIDVEGAEMDVLRGAAQVLRASRPRIFLEAHTAALEAACMRELSLLGYRARRLEANPGGDEQTRHLIATPV